MKIVPIFTILEKDILSVPVKLKLLKTYLKLLKKKKKMHLFLSIRTGAPDNGLFALPLTTKTEALT